MIIEEGWLMVIARYLETNYFIKHSCKNQQEILLQSKSGFGPIFFTTKATKVSEWTKNPVFLITACTTSIYHPEYRIK